MAKKEEKKTLEEVMKDLNRRGVLARSQTKVGLTEENPGAYKDVSAVVEVVHQSGIAGKVAKLKPIGVIKG